MERFGPVLNCLAEEPQKTWILEHVATFSRFRGKGLAEGVVSRVIEEGFAAGCDFVQVSLFLGNKIARKFYLKLGFKPADNPRMNPLFEHLMGSPGTESLVLDRRNWIESSSGLVTERTASQSPRGRSKRPKHTPGVTHRRDPFAQPGAGRRTLLAAGPQNFRVACTPEYILSDEASDPVPFRTERAGARSPRNPL